MVTQNGLQNMSQLNGTAIPSLALENLQELEDQHLSGPDRNEAEEVVAGALASMYTGQYPLSRIDLIESFSKAGLDTVSRRTYTCKPIDVSEH